MELIITDTSETMASWLAKPYLNEETRKLLTGVDAMIVPQENFRDYEIPLFPSNLMVFYDILKAHLKVEAAINEEDYREVSLNSRMHRYGKTIVHAIAIPIFVGVVSNLISELLKQDLDDEVEIEVIIQHNPGKSTSVKYQGPIIGFNQVATKIKEIAYNGNSREHRTDTTKSTNESSSK
ncbi:hypothetical protein EDD80_11811 [Anseongella ginsenosidimutans]|uniref:Uncharacterized protein n=1 Tax=Anseongella ginsenosidimutans TaxID=496056 RepID=A0A4R3KL79_9SPHI|nr:hypothetical protein [Anseongella ginsenosidimutans]QEC51956.1 hypothetical protein FRZ59_06155 [Anseongella ginsenosidimutans]TCS84742.1 hypothetical protein EDD80_11811 [Anseongella ginsenosidimutans]